MFLKEAIELHERYSPAVIGGLVGLEIAADRPGSVHVRSEEARVLRGDQIIGRAVDLGFPY